jgi:hypothetical protein
MKRSRTTFSKYRKIFLTMKTTTMAIIIVMANCTVLCICIALYMSSMWYWFFPIASGFTTAAMIGTTSDMPKVSRMAPISIRKIRKIILTFCLLSRMRLIFFSFLRMGSLPSVYRCRGHLRCASAERRSSLLCQSVICSLILWIFGSSYRSMKSSPRKIFSFTKCRESTTV